MPSSQVSIPAQAGGFSQVVVPLPVGTCCARVQPTLVDGDWTAGQTLTISVLGVAGGVTVPGGVGAVVQTGARQSDPTNPVPAFGGLVNFDGQGTLVAWSLDSILVTVAGDDPNVQVGAVVSFADTPANMPEPILPPGFVAGTKI